MASRSIGIEINHSLVQAVQLKQGHKKATIEAAHAEPVTTSAENSHPDAADYARAIEALFADGKLKKGLPTAVALPDDTVFFRRLELRLPEREQVRRVLKSQLEEHVPISFENIAADLAGWEPSASALAAATDRYTLTTFRQAAARAAIAPRVTSCTACGIWEAATRAIPDDDHGHVVLYADAARVLLLTGEGRQLLGVRSLNLMGCVDGEWLSREIRLTWRRIRTDAAEPLRLYLAGDEAAYGQLYQQLADEFEDAHQLDLLGEFTHPEGADVSIPATGLALQMLGKRKDILDFSREMDFGRQTARNLRLSLLAAGGLVAASLALWMAGLVLQVRSLDQKRHDLDRTIRTVFTKTLPDVRHIVKELPQMDEHLQELQKQYDVLAAAADEGPSPLEVLRRVCEKMPADLNVHVDNLSVEKKAVRVIATGDSVAAAAQFANALGECPEFESVSVRDVKLEKSGKARFILQMSRISG